MAENITARKNGGWKVVSIAPDVCKTPMGASIPPVPYPVVAKLEQAVSEVDNVRTNGDPLLVHNYSKIPVTHGDMAGTAKGIKSGTVGSNCYPLEHSGTVRVGKKYILRHGDKFWMNGA